jgi:predicted amidohydrolase
MRNITVASVQFESKPGDKQANLATIRRFVESAAQQKAEIIAFPECCITGYWFLRNLNREEFAALAEPVFEGPSSPERTRLGRARRIAMAALYITRLRDVAGSLNPSSSSELFGYLHRDAGPLPEALWLVADGGDVFHD